MGIVVAHPSRRAEVAGGMSFKGDHEQLFDRCRCGRRKMKNEYACEICYRQGRQPERLARFGKFVAKPRFQPPSDHCGGDSVKGLTLCDLCPKFAECRECVLNNRVLACEWAVAEDAER